MFYCGTILGSPELKINEETFQNIIRKGWTHLSISGHKRQKRGEKTKIIHCSGCIM